jgi:hypothetical protein
LRLAGVILLPHVALEGFIDSDFQLLTLDGDFLGLGQPFVFLGLGCGGFLFLWARAVREIRNRFIVLIGFPFFLVVLRYFLVLRRSLLLVFGLLRHQALGNIVIRHALRRFNDVVGDFPSGIGHGGYSLG